MWWIAGLSVSHFMILPDTARGLSHDGSVSPVPGSELAGPADLALGSVYVYGQSQRCLPVTPLLKYSVLASTDWSWILPAGGVANLMEWSGWSPRLEAPGVVRWIG